MRWKPLVAIAVGALVAVTAAAQQQVYNITWLSADLSTSGSDAGGANVSERTADARTSLRPRASRGDMPQSLVPPRGS